MPTFLSEKGTLLGVLRFSKRCTIHLITKTQNIMKLNILFIINNPKTSSTGKCILMCRLTYRKSRKSFSTGLIFNPLFWNSKQQRVKTPEPDSQYINTQLSLIKQNLNQAFLMLQIQESSFDVHEIYSLYKGKDNQKHRNRFIRC